jgi:hypothetical protein
MPDPAFAIDDEIETLFIKEGRLRRNFQGDPYLTARCYLGRAIAIARKDEVRQKFAREVLRSALKEQVKKALDIERQLRRLAEEARISLATAITKGAEGLDAEAELRRRELPDEAIDAVHNLADGLKAHRDKTTQGSDDDFRPAFIEEMVYCWVRLSGKAPGKTNEKFARFVDLAHRTLGKATPIGLGLPFYVDDWDTEAERARNAKIKAGGLNRAREAKI